MVHEVEAKPYGAVVDGKEFVFCSADEVRVDDRPAVFIGTAGYARQNEVALFEGSKVGFQGLVVERISGEFGLSAGRQAGGAIVGRIAGRSGGAARLTLPAGLDASHCQVKIDGVVVPHTFHGAAICFDVQVEQSDGTKSYAVEVAGGDAA